MIDNLKDAIAHAKEVAEMNRQEAKAWQGCAIQSKGKTEANKCLECANEHEQLAEWLTELKERREADRWIPVSERLPKYSGLYLISVDDVVTVANFTGTYFMHRGGGRVEVYAWKPLPKPYESEYERLLKELEEEAWKDQMYQDGIEAMASEEDP